MSCTVNLISDNTIDKLIALLIWGGGGWGYNSALQLQNLIWNISKMLDNAKQSQIEQYLSNIPSKKYGTFLLLLFNIIENKCSTY